jgi:RHS repeat-associated protein
MGFGDSNSPLSEKERLNGKELDIMNGLNLYDFVWRGYDPATGRFLTIDPLCEKYPWISSYAYCLNNPIRFVDMDGRDPGDIFKTPRDAAYDWGKYYNGASILRGHEFGSTIYVVKNKDGEAVGYSYSIANEGKGDGHVNPSIPPDFEKEVADIHSHENYKNPNDNKFSIGDISDNNWRKNIGYLTTPDGSLKEYNSSTKKITIINTDLPSDPNDPGRKNKIDPTDVPKAREHEKIAKDRAATSAEQDKKPEINIPEMFQGIINWAF